MVDESLSWLVLGRDLVLVPWWGSVINCMSWFIERSWIMLEFSVFLASIRPSFSHTNFNFPFARWRRASFATSRFSEVSWERMYICVPRIGSSGFNWTTDLFWCYSRISKTYKRVFTFFEDIVGMERNLNINHDTSGFIEYFQCRVAALQHSPAQF